MEVKTYTTYAEINKELEILKIEKDLAYQKLLKDIEETKESLKPKNIVGDAPKKVMKTLSMFSGPVKSTLMTLLFRKLF